MLRPVKQPFIHSLYIFYLNTLQIGIDQNGSRIIADHAATVSRTRPFGKETTFLVSIDKSLLNFPVYRRIHQIKERKQTTECIPETRIGVHIAGKHFPIIGAVVNGSTLLVQLVKSTGEKQRAVQAGIESAVLVEVSALHFNLAQHIVPSITSFLHQRVKTVRTQFEQVPLSLSVADKRRSNTCMHNLAFLRLKSDNRTCMGSLLLFLRFLNYTVFNRSGICKRFVELYNKVVSEILRYTAAVTGGISDDPVLFRYNPDIGTAVESIYHHIGMFIFRKCETEQHGTFGRSKLRHHIVLRQIYLIIMRQRNLTFMREPACTFVLIENRLPGNRHNGELPVIVYPWTGLVRLLEASDFIGRIDILPAIPHFSGLRCPKIHSPRTRNGGIGVSGRKLECGLSAHQRIYILYPILSLYARKTA